MLIWPRSSERTMLPPELSLSPHAVIFASRHVCALRPRAPRQCHASQVIIRVTGP